MHIGKLSALSLSLCLLLFLASPAFAAGGASGSGAEAQESFGNEGASECDGSQAREGSGEREASYGQSQYSPSYGGGEACGEGSQADPAGPEAKKQDRNQERVQLEKREGEYPEDPNGTGDRSRDRTRTEEQSSESSSSAVPTEFVEPSGTIDMDGDVSVEMPARGLAAGVLKGWLEDALSFIAGLFA